MGLLLLISAHAPEQLRGCRFLADGWLQLSDGGTGVLSTPLVAISPA